MLECVIHFSISAPYIIKIIGDKIPPGSSNTFNHVFGKVIFDKMIKSDFRRSDCTFDEVIDFGFRRSVI